MLFRKQIFFFFAIVGIAFLFAGHFLVRIRHFDGPLYRKLVQESSELRSRRSLERHPARQNREGVQKDIWAIDGVERLHFRLNSAYSELSLSQRKDKVEAVEDLQQVRCLMQEEVHSGSQMQQVRTLTAAEGTYHYPSHRFLAQTVHLAFYRLPGLELPTDITAKPFLTSVAREASFAATGKIPIFTAYHVTAQVDPERGIP